MSTTVFLIVTLIAGAALAWSLYKKMEGWTGPVGLLAMVCVLYGSGLTIVSLVNTARTDTLNSLEQRYDIDIERESLSLTGEPEPWRINDEWYTCYTTESKTEGEQVDLYCGTPAVDFRSADFFTPP